MSRIELHPLPGTGPVDEVLVGSADDCQIQIVDDGYVSKHHAKIVRAVGRNPVNGCPGIFEVFDLGSVNGTWVRRDPDRMLRAEPFITLLLGDVIQVGKTRLPQWPGYID